MKGGLVFFLYDFGNGMEWRGEGGVGELVLTSSFL